MTQRRSSSRLYTDTPYAEPEGFWKRVRWWISGAYEYGDSYEREQRRRRSHAQEIVVDLRQRFPDSPVTDYVEREYGDGSGTTGASTRVADELRQHGPTPERNLG